MHNISVYIERTIPELPRHVGVHLLRRHHNAANMPDGDRDYFCLLEYNPYDSIAGRAVMHLSHIIHTVEKEVPVDNYLFELRARSDEAVSGPINLRFEQLPAGNSRVFTVSPSALATSDLRSPRLEIANGSTVALRNYSNESFSLEGVSVTNVARAMQTLASCVKSKITYQAVSEKCSFALEGIRQWVVWNSPDPAQFETTSTPSIASLTDKHFTLMLLFRWANGRYYAAFFPPREYDEWWLDYGDWEILVELTDANGNAWQRLLKVELRLDQMPRWIDAFTPLTSLGNQAG